YPFTTTAPLTRRALAQGTYPKAFLCPAQGYLSDPRSLCFLDQHLGGHRSILQGVPEPIGGLLYGRLLLRVGRRSEQRRGGHVRHALPVEPTSPDGVRHGRPCLCERTLGVGEDASSGVLLDPSEQDGASRRGE